MKIYAVCDKFGIISLMTKNFETDVVTSGNLLVFENKDNAENACEHLNALYRNDSMCFVRETEM